jgi:hypothetical protein
VGASASREKRRTEDRVAHDNNLGSALGDERSDSGKRLVNRNRENIGRCFGRGNTVGNLITRSGRGVRDD